MLARFALFTFIFCAFFANISPQAVAQDEEVKSLGDILNQPTTKNQRDEPLNSSSMANLFFKECTYKESLVLTDTEKEILCGCMSAKMAETLTIEEFRVLKEKSRKGRDARSKTIAYAFAPCVPFVIEGKVKDDCMISPINQEIIRGKEKICRCVNNRFEQFLAQNISYIISDSLTYEPMSLNPLERYFIGEGYQTQHRIFTKQCNFEFRYKKDN